MLNYCAKLKLEYHREVRSRMADKEGCWVRVAADAALDEGARLAVRVAEQRVLLLRRDGLVYAVENDCPHLGCTFTRGAFEGYALTCPCHDWTFDIRTGAFALAPEITLRTYACRAEDGELYLEMGGDSDGQN
jgi:3-phenylpropionate/trans-cinnamate dioxygenase ferredoxin subunit